GSPKLRRYTPYVPVIMSKNPTHQGFSSTAEIKEWMKLLTPLNCSGLQSKTAVLAISAISGSD
ncbi:hypothetical protein, partial [Pseudomonas amygdali]|uniref:hypothetical protein n=1 Tax=Pseudomonas amygdali TaxID=47877 RepID=UPI00217F93DF